MQVRPSRLLKKLRDGQIPTCLKLNLADARVVEIAGLAISPNMRSMQKFKKAAKQKIVKL